MSEAKEAEGTSQVEAGKRLEELRRRRGETESEEFEKLKQKQQEAALELEELKKKREERRKVLEEEEQRRKQEEAERKVREEVRRAQLTQARSPRLATLVARGIMFSLVQCCCMDSYKYILRIINSPCIRHNSKPFTHSSLYPIVRTF